MNEENTLLAFKPLSDEAGKRLDAYLAEKIEGWSRTRLRRLIEEGDALVNQHVSKPAYRLRPDDEVEVELTELPATRFEPENIPLDIIYEDECLAVINKPAGMIVHPGAGVSSGTLANALAWHFGRDLSSVSSPLHDERGGIAELRARIGIIHRLDKDTSGLIVAAKSEEISEALSAQFHNRTVEKHYIALVHGSTRENLGKIDRPIARDRWHRTKMTIAANGRNALTLWKTARRFEKFTLLDVEIKTGRTHQIRVHLASINHPVVGDIIYGQGRDNTVADIKIREGIKKLGRFFLHAAKLSFTHPTNGEKMSFSIPLPTELQNFLRLLSAK